MVYVKAYQEKLFAIHAHTLIHTSLGLQVINTVNLIYKYLDRFIFCFTMNYGQKKIVILE